MKRGLSGIVFFAALCGAAAAVSAGAVDIARLADYQFVWPGSEEAKISFADRGPGYELPLSDSTHSFDALHYSLDLDFPMQGGYFRGRTALRLRVVDDHIGEVALHMVHLVADSAFASGNRASFERSDSTITIDLGRNRFAGDTLSVEVYYHDVSVNRGYYYYQRDAYTMSEPSDARWWFPCFDEPWDKATSEITATVPENYDVGSNGYLDSVSHDQENHTKTYHWVNDAPIATYLMNLIMGDYAVWNDYYVIDYADSIPILYMVYAEDSTSAAYDFENVPAMMAVFSQLFYPYPFNKYGQGAVFPFQYGGMEHQTMTTIHRNWITGDRSAEGAVSHELGHMWWGDFVTLADWRHIWLNEGFATYCTALFGEEFYGEQAFRQTLDAYREAYLIDVQNFGPHPLYDPEDLFSTQEYVKGAWVLHMLRGIIGDEAFYGGLHYYASLYGGGNASTGDFQQAMETISGSDLGWFFQEWIFGPAHPVYHYAWNYAGQGPYTVHLEIQQVQTDAPPFRMPIGIKINTVGDDYDFQVINEDEFQDYDFIIPQLPIDLAFDPDNWILKESEEVTSIEGGRPPELPRSVELGRIYPNPFNSSTNINFHVQGVSQSVTITAYDISGRLVGKIADGIFSPGYHTLRFESGGGGKDALASGVYIVRMSSSSGDDSRLITLLK